MKNHLFAVAVLLLGCLPGKVEAGAYTFAEGVADPDDAQTAVTYSYPYPPLSPGGTYLFTIGIDPSNPTVAASALQPLLNVIQTYNDMVWLTGNLAFDWANIPFGHYDFESALLHEVGHTLGMAHPNLATESGLPSTEHNFTKTLTGLDGVYNTGAGTDGIKGSADDVRGDDVNIHWFVSNTNNPFDIPSRIDRTTYTNDLADLPTGDLFVANADRTVATLFSLATPNFTEAVMQQEQVNNEIQRDLGADDVATLLMARAGIDRVAGTADDFKLLLAYEPNPNNADAVIYFNSTGFASSSNSAYILTNEPGELFVFTFSTSGFPAIPALGIPAVPRSSALGLFFNQNINWYFNTTARAASAFAAYQQSNFTIAEYNLGNALPGVDIDNDRLPTLIEYIFARDAENPDTGKNLSITRVGGRIRISFPVNVNANDFDFAVYSGSGLDVSTYTEEAITFISKGLVVSSSPADYQVVTYEIDSAVAANERRFVSVLFYLVTPLATTFLNALP